DEGKVWFAEFNSDDVIPIVNRLHCLNQVRSLVQSKEIRRLRYKTLGDFSLDHSDRTRPDVITLAADKLHNLIVELLLILFGFSIAPRIPFFFGFESPVLWLVFGHDLHLERLRDRVQNALRRTTWEISDKRVHQPFRVEANPKEIPAIRQTFPKRIMLKA